jgi:hypothetical protein
MANFTTKADLDATNRPSLVMLNGVTLPIDTTISLNGEKVIAESKILDGASVFERVSRKPYEIEFNFTIREQDPTTKKYIFGQNTSYELTTDVWELDEVLELTNTWLNKKGIQNVIVKSFTEVNVRGNTNIIGSLKCLEMRLNLNQTKSLNIPV